jgi:protein-tyrosine phosphatase
MKDRFTCEIMSEAPIMDAAPAPSLDWLRERVKFVDEQRKAGKTTYVHCAAGVSRSGMVVTAYLMYRNGWSRDETLAFVRSRRPVTNPNPAFMKLLEEWEQELKKPWE